MHKSTYDRTTLQEFMNRKVITLRELANGMARIPAGTVCSVYGKRGGLNLETEPCPMCGIRIVITQVSHASVDFYEEPASA